MVENTAHEVLEEWVVCATDYYMLGSVILYPLRVNNLFV